MTIERIILGVFIATTCAAAPIDWPHLKLTRVAETRSEAACITRARDGSDRLFIALRYGQIKMVVNGQLQADPFLDISSKLENLEYSYGIPGLAFPPNFAEKQYFYVLYARNYQSLVLSRFHVPPASAVADVNSEEVLMTVDMPFYPYMHGGYIDFGPDGYLYVAIGEPDKYSRYSTQAFDNIGGKILRIDTESTNSGYVIPADNPFAGHATNRNEIWCWGLMIPWSFSFDRLTGDFYMIDKLISNSEINYAPAGKGGGVNYGWPGWDAPPYLPKPGTMPPILITGPGYELSVGGIVYRGPQTSRMTNIYIFSGVGFHSLAGLARDGTNWVRQDFTETPGEATKFAEDDSGRLYVLLWEGSYYGDTLYLIEDSGKVRPPTLVPTGSIHTETPVITSTTPSARIRYTTDGRDPGPGDPEIVSGQTITVSTGMTVKAQALRDDLLPSDIVAATYTAFKVATPWFQPNSGSLTLPLAVPNPAFISITSATPGVTIRYTLDGLFPTLSSPVYTAPIEIPGAGVIHALAYRDGFQDSDLNFAQYTWATAEAPVFNPPSGPITNGTWITMSSSTPGAKMRYTLDGTEPSVTSVKYTNAILINGNTTVKAKTFAKGYQVSSTTSVLFDRVKPLPPVISPPGGVVTNSARITMSCATRNARIRYTLDGTIPGPTSPIFLRSLVIPAPVTVSARAYASDMDPSDVTVVEFGAFVLQPTIVQTVAGNGEAGFADGPASQARFRYPNGICVDKWGTLFIADTRNYAIRKIDTNGIVSTLAGSGINASIDGIGTNASFSEPLGVAMHPNGNLYVSDRSTELIRVITPAGEVKTIANIGNGYMRGLWHINFSSKGLLYTGSFRYVASLSPTGTLASVYNGIDGCLDTWDNWDVWTSVAVDPPDRVYAVTGRQLVKFGGTCEQVVAGGGRGFSDGPRLQSRFSTASGIAIGADGKIFITDDNCVRMIETNGFVSTLAGYGAKGFRNGPSAIAQFQANIGICVASNGAIYVTDAGNHAVRRISFDRDQDGIPDVDERTNGPFRLARNDALRDNDGDGYSNADEFWAGTNPNDSNSVLRVLARYDGSNGVVVSWPTTPARSYVLAASTNLVDWQALPAVPGDGVAAGITNSLAAPRSFYKLRVEP